MTGASYVTIYNKFLNFSSKDGLYDFLGNKRLRSISKLAMNNLTTSIKLIISPSQSLDLILIYNIWGNHEA